MDAHIKAGPPCFETWRVEIESAPDIERLLSAVRRFLAAWPPEALEALPVDVASRALPSRESIHARAFLASRAELATETDDPCHPALREMALAMAAAAARLGALESYEALTKRAAAGRAPRER